MSLPKELDSLYIEALLGLSFGAVQSRHFIEVSLFSSAYCLVLYSYI